MEQFGEKKVMWEDKKVLAYGPFYQCDPEKNKLCKRGICYKHFAHAPEYKARAECHLTKDKEFALEADQQPYYILTYTDMQGKMQNAEVPRSHLFK